MSDQSNSKHNPSTSADPKMAKDVTSAVEAPKEDKKPGESAPTPKS